jgi:hypothetical protein
VGTDAMPTTQAGAILISVIAGSFSIADTVTHAELSKKHIETVREVRAALRACWIPPSSGIEHANTTISVRVSFKQNGEILGIPLITYTSAETSGDERRAYRLALDEASVRCSPLPFSDTFGSVIAGGPIKRTISFKTWINVKILRLSP